MSSPRRYVLNALMTWCKTSDFTVSFLQVDWQWAGQVQPNLSLGDEGISSVPSTGSVPSAFVSVTKAKDPVLLVLSSVLNGILDAEGNPLIEADRQLQAATVVVVISVLSAMLCFVVFLLASFAPPSVGPTDPKDGGTGTHSPGKQLCPELITPAGGELLTLPAWVFSGTSAGDPTWNEDSVDFCDLEGNPRLRLEVQIAIDGNEHVILKDAYDNRTFAFCALPVGNAQAPLRIHRGDGELFALLGRVPEHGGFALAGCSTSQRYLPVPSKTGCPAMRVTTERNDGFVALAEGPIVRLGGGVDAGLVLLGLIALRRHEVVASKAAKPQTSAAAKEPSAFGPPQNS